MGLSMVEVEITNKNAIYVDGLRITDRSTKWGIHDIVESFKCKKVNVVKNCIARGYEGAVKRIDDDDYAQ